MPPRARRLGDPSVAVAYLRVSKEDQRLGPEAQRAAIEAWAASQGATVVAWCIDQGVSSVTPIDQRAALVAALAAVRAHNAGTLVVAKRDRIARDVVLAAQIEGTVAAAGAAVVSAAGEANGSNPADQFMKSVIDAAAQYERALIRARTKAALAAKRARGENSGNNVPFGYRVEAGRRVVDEREAGIVTRAKALQTAGLSVRGIAAQLAIEGVTGRTGRAISSAQVHRICKIL